MNIKRDKLVEDMEETLVQLAKLSEIIERVKHGITEIEEIEDAMRTIDEVEQVILNMEINK